MAKKPKAEGVTPDQVDDMSDEQIAELQDELRAGDADTGQDEGTEQQAAQEQATKDAGHQQPGDDGQQPGDAGQDEDGEPGKTDKVDFKRYDYERNRRKAAEEARAQERERYERRFEELLALAQQRSDQSKPAAEAETPQVPNAAEEPYEALQWAVERLANMDQQQRETQAETQQRQEHDQQMAQFFGQVADIYAKEVETDPSVGEAYQIAEQSFVNEMQFRGVPAFQINQALANYRANFAIEWANGAGKQGMPLGEFIKGVAKARGWAPNPAGQGDQQQPAPTNGNGGQQQQDTTEAARRARTLSNGGGSPGVNDMPTAQQMLEMDDAEWDAHMAKFGGLSGALAAQ